MKVQGQKIKISEHDFSTQVESLLSMFHWRWCHFRPARTEHSWRTAMTGDKGFPDYIATRPPRLLIFELKNEKGKLTPEQEAWLADLKESQRMITLEPVVLQRGKMAHLDSGNDISLIPSFEVYLWRPSDFNEIASILR